VECAASELLWAAIGAIPANPNNPIATTEFNIMRIASISSGVRDHRYEVQSVLSRKLRAIADA
jgi:hypothetical protein